MSINRNDLVTRHNPKLSAVDFSSPLSVGNGDFVYTADITGLQSLTAEYAATFPLCTMAHWSVHTLPADHPRYRKKETPQAKQDTGVRQGGTPTTATTEPGISFVTYTSGTACPSHPTPASDSILPEPVSYTLADLRHTAYPYRDRTVASPVHREKRQFTPGFGKIRTGQIWQESDWYIRDKL